MTLNELMDASERQIFAKIKITYSDATTDNSIAASSATTGLYTQEDQVFDTVTETPYKWFSLHDNLLDGTYHFPPSDGEEQIGWWNDALSDGAGSFSSPPIITVTFAPRPVTRLEVVGDNSLNVFPVDFVIKLYDSIDTLLHTETVVGNTLMSWFTDITAVEAVVKMTLTVSKINTANVCAKILNFFSPLYQIYTGVSEDARDLLEVLSFNPTSTSANGTSYPQLYDGLDSPTRKWTTLHENVLDGSYKLIPADASEQVGWWDTNISDINGNFVVNPVFLATFQSTKLDKLIVSGDDILDVVIEDFDITVYDSTGSVLHTESITGNTLAHWEKNITPVAGASKIKLEVIKINQANYAAHLLEALPSVAADALADGELVDLNVLEELEYFSGGIPIGTISSNEIDVSLDNSTHQFDIDNTDSPIYGFLKRRRKIEPWLGITNPTNGIVDWYPLGQFWTVKWNVPDSSLVAYVTGRDILELMRTTVFVTSALYQDYSLYSLFKLILDDFNFLGLEYEIDTALQSIIIPFAWFDRVSHRTALEQLAKTSTVNVYIDRSGKVVIQQVTPTAGVIYEMDDDKNYFSKNYPYAWAEITNTIEVISHEYELQSEQSVFSSDTTFSVPAGSQVEKTFVFNTIPSNNISAVNITAGPNTSVLSYNAYAWGVVATIQNTGGAAESVTAVSILGTPLELKNTEVASALDSTEVLDNGEIATRLTNVFIQDREYAQELADAIIVLFKSSRQDISLDARGHIGLLLGDRVTVAGKTEQYMISRQEINWVGALSASIEGKIII